MERVSGASNWRLRIRRETDRIIILRAETCDPEAVLPETLFGIPVSELGSHAIAADPKSAEGEAVEVVGAPGRTEWGNRNLKVLTLPKTLLRVGNYAFLNCGSLHEIRLYDNIEQWGGSVFMNCRSLERFRLTRERRTQGETLAYLNDVLTQELDISVTEADGQQARLLFPEYIESYEENCPAHHFDLRIFGAGYPYHHCFTQKQFDFAHYDRLWEGFLRMEHEDETALRIAWYRLRWPMGLSEAAEGQYLAYLRVRAAEALQWRLAERDTEGVRFLLKRAAPTPEQLREAASTARENGDTPTLALLLEEQHRRVPKAKKRFDL